jgi:hypothetical protein
MMKKLLIATFVTALAVPALAQSPMQQGSSAGSAAGANVGGTVGAAVGGIVGAAVAVPAEVIGAVTGATTPSVRVEERIVVGEPLPTHVVVRPVPNHRDYSYAVVNERRVIVEPRTRKVIRVIE